jgi:hypothetical protein
MSYSVGDIEELQNRVSGSHRYWYRDTPGGIAFQHDDRFETKNDDIGSLHSIEGD